MIFGAKGTMLHFYTTSFKNAAGQTITGGTIYLQLVEMYSPGDMVANRATTMNNANMLTSGGQISVSATMNGQTVYIRQYGLGFIQSTTSSQTMQLFPGNVANGDSIANWGTPVSDSLNGRVAFGADSNNVIANAYGRPWVGYVFDTASTDSSSSLQYTNCDAFYYNDSPKASVAVVMPDTSFNPNNTEVFLVLPSINCVMSTIEPQLGSNSYNAATNTINIVSEGNTAIVPAGMSYELVVVAIKNGQYYYYTHTGTIPDSGVLVTSAMTPETQSYVQTQLANL
jgi:hypothetical protein